MMKYPTTKGVGMIKGEQKASRDCYATALKGVRTCAVVQQKEPLFPNSQNNKARQSERVEATESWSTSKEESEQVQLGSLVKKVNIRMGMQAPLRSQIVDFLQGNSDVFAWSHEDMPGIDPSVILHRLNVDPSYKPVKQKRWLVDAAQSVVIYEEVDKLLKADFIKEVYYHAWLSNVVMVKKANGK